MKVNNLYNTRINKCIRAGTLQGRTCLLF